MNQIGTAREALIVEAMGDVAQLLDRVEALQVNLIESCRAQRQVDAHLRDSLVTFTGQVLALTERSKIVAVKHIVERTNEAAQRSVDLQSKVMADAARAAFGAQIGPTLQRLQAALQPLIDRPRWNWEAWLTHVAAAATAAASTWAAMLFLYAR